MKTLSIVYTTGAFDLLHVGHLNYLRQAKELGDILIVGLLTDEFTTVYQGRPVTPFEQRKQIVEALPCVDVVVAHDGFKDVSWIESYGVDIRVVCEEYGTHKEQREIRKELEGEGVKYVVIKRTPGVSVTKIKEACCERLVVSADCPGGVASWLPD